MSGLGSRDFLLDFQEACDRQGIKYLVVLSDTRNEGRFISSNLSELPQHPLRKDVTKRQDLFDSISAGLDENLE